jgi:hypothetical protein
VKYGNDPLVLSICNYLIENNAYESGWDKQELEWQSEGAATDCTSLEWGVWKLFLASYGSVKI